MRHDTDRRDGGFTLIEILIVISVMSIIVGALATVFSVIVRTSPTTEIRIDDARSTRGLQTWLSHDTMSTPPFASHHETGWIDESSLINRCGADGEKIVEFRWREAGYTTRQFAVSYRFVVDGDEGHIVRTTCGRTGDEYGTYSVTSKLNLTAGLDPSASQDVTLNDDDSDGRVESVTFHLTATSGEVVDVETGSRNPVEFFPT